MGKYTSQKELIKRRDEYREKHMIGNIAIDRINRLDEYINGSSLEIYLDKFIDNINTIANKYDVNIVTDLDAVKLSILGTKKNGKPRIKRRYVVKKGNSMEGFDESNPMENRVKAFKRMYKNSLKAFIGIINSLSKENKLDKPAKDIIKPFLDLEVKE